MSKKNIYNPNSKYGQRKIRQEANRLSHEAPSEEKTNSTIFVFIMLFIICFIAWLILGTEGFLKWATQ